MSPVRLRTLTVILLELVVLSTGQVRAQENGSGSSTAGVGTSFSIGGDFFGMAPYPVRSNGLRVGYFLSDNFEIEATSLRAKTEVLLTKTVYTESGIRLTTFADENFYWGCGISVRDVTLGYKLFVAEGETMDSTTEHHQALTGTAHFGFQFTIFDRVTIGSDLAGVSVPIHWFKRDNEFPADANEREDDPKDFPMIKESLGANLQFFKTYVKVRL